MADFARTLIYVHAGFGGLALLFGTISLITTKGSQPHKKSGLVFYYCMLTSTGLALVIAVLPKHESTFLFSIGLFSLYFILLGYRARNFKHQFYDTKMERLMALFMMTVCTTMIGYSVLVLSQINTILLVFGMFGLFISIRDYYLFKQVDRLRKCWLKMHLGNMIGGYIAALTAFVVVNNIFPKNYGWFIPGVLGGLYIMYWMNKLNRKVRIS